MNGSNTTSPAGVYGTQTVFAAGNTPPGLYEACQWTDQQGYFWLFAGLNNSSSDRWGDLWKFDPVANQWAWMKGPGIANQAGVYGTINVPSLTNNPGGRGYGEISWVDNNNNLWMYGGYGYDVNSVYANLGDLWEYNISSNNWTWMSGSSTTAPAPVYGTLGVPDPANTPGGRCESNCSWVDNNNNLWMYGGYLNAGDVGSDLWMYNTSLNEWAWMSGSSTSSATPVYGTKGVPDPANFPGGRRCYSAWKSTSDDLWLFGGTNLGDFADMWKYNIATNEWTWMSGSDVSGAPGNSGSNCIPDTAYYPSSRYENRACWTLGCDNFVNYGSTTGDMWNFNVSTLQWTCMNGTANTAGTPNWGTILVSSPTNTPGDRWGSLGFKDLLGNLWLFGGDLSNYRNDMWKFVVDTTCPQDAGVSVSSAFNATPLNGCTPLTVTFNNTSVNGTSFLWNFGDTTTSTLMNPTHTYTDTGYFTVTLIAINNSACGSGADTTIHTNYIHVSPSAHIAFHAQPLSGCAPLNVQFTSDSAIGVSSYSWSFGDGGTSQSVSPSHTYSNHGTYEITLIGYSSNGCNDTVHLNSIVVDTIPIVTTAFSAMPLSGCNPLTVTFNNSTTNGHNYIWNFGDSSTDTAANPTHTYNQSGTYTVTLIALDSSACGIGIDTLIQTAYIVVNPFAVAHFTPDTLLGCAPFIVGFTNTSIHAVSYLWNFGDGNNSTDTNATDTYLNAGVYTVTLIAFGAGGCNDTIQYSPISVINHPVVTSPFTSDTFQGCNPLTINFTNNSTEGTKYYWSFGDGGTASTFNATHTYTDTGEFTVKLVTTNDTSICGVYADSVIKNEYILIADPVKVTGSFTVSPVNGCTPLMITISNKSSNGSSYIWNFGNGESLDTSIPPPIYYLDAGTYNITLLASNYNARCYNAPDSMSIQIVVDSCNLYIPNVFSPNNDGRNDYFDLIAEGYSNYHLIIFDRWGLKVFESNNNELRWNGTLNNNGSQCPDGTYYYIFSAFDFYNVPFNDHGFLTLIR
jgi:gliding motility-associated-like protein